MTIKEKRNLIIYSLIGLKSIFDYSNIVYP